MGKNSIPKRKFIEIVPIKFKGSMGLRYIEDYFAVPADVASDCGYDVEVVSTATVHQGVVDTLEKTGKKIKKLNFKVLNIYQWADYINYLKNNREAVIFSNDRTLKSFITTYFGKNTIFMSHQSKLPSKYLHRLLFKYVIKRFDRIKVSNPYEKEELIKFGVNKKKIHYIPIPIDHKFYSKKSSKTEITSTRKKYGIKKNEIVLLFLANVRQFKRPKTILKAIKKLKDDNIPIKLIVAGDDSLKTEGVKSLMEEAKELQIKDRIIVTGWIDPEEVRKIINISKLCINSSIHEGQCLVVYEASCAQIPLCISNIGSFTSVFSQSALFHDPEDHNKLANNIKYYLDNPKIASKHTRINKQIVIDRCDYDVVKKQMKKLFTDFN